MAGPASVFRRLVAAVTGTLTIGLFAIGGGATAVSMVTIQPAVGHDFAFVTSSQAPPTQAQCASLNQPTGRRCFAPDAIRNSYNIGPLYEQGFDGTGYTIALVDSFGSVNIRSDLKVFDDSFGLPHMCGEGG
jgi:subtilase family serine protease